MKRIAVAFVISGITLSGAWAEAQPVLTVDEAVAIALRENVGIRMARNQAEIAARDHALAYGAFLPRATAGASQNNTVANSRQNFRTGDPIDRTGATSSTFSAGANISWRIFDGMGMFSAYDQVRSLRDMGELGAEDHTESIVARVMTAYYDVVRQEQQLLVFDNAVEISEERTRIARLKADVGTGSELEWRQAMIDLNRDRSNRLQQQIAIEQARASLDELMGRGSPPAYDVVNVIEVEGLPAVESLAEWAARRNTRLQFLDVNQQVAELELRRISAERFPTIDLQAGYGYSQLESEVGVLQSSRSADFRYGVTASFDLFRGFDRRRRSEAARIQIRNAQLAIDEAQTAIVADMRAWYVAYENHIARTTLQVENLEYAELNVEIALDRFELGTITSLELREIQNQLVDTESRLINAQFEAKRAEIELKRLAGMLLEA